MDMVLWSMRVLGSPLHQGLRFFWNPEAKRMAWPESNAFWTFSRSCLLLCRHCIQDWQLSVIKLQDWNRVSVGFIPWWMVDVMQKNSLVSWPDMNQSWFHMWNTWHMWNTCFGWDNPDISWVTPFLKRQQNWGLHLSYTLKLLPLMPTNWSKSSSLDA